MKTIPYEPEAYQLLHDGALALSQVESNGVGIDVPYIDRMIEKLNRKVKQLNEGMQETEIGKTWTKTYGRNTNFNSPIQFRAVVFDKMGHKSIKETNSKLQSTDEEAISVIDDPFIKSYLKAKGYEKAIKTNLIGIRNEVVSGRAHCFYNFGPESYRSGCADFNYQNIPNRDPYLGKIIRGAFIPKKGNRLLELDINGAEVRTGCAYHKDERMISYVLDPSTDMHRDVARVLFKIPDEEDVTKQVRFAAKGPFVFAEFYGDWYKNVTKNIWPFVLDPNVLMSDGQTLKAHMRDVGLHRLGELNPDGKVRPLPGTFEAHVQKTERHFWDVRFRGYNAWRQSYYGEYCDRGWFKTLTGFVCQGYMNRKQVTNFPIQGSAFHILLKVLIRLINVEMPKRGMKSMCIGEIHDSMIFDAVPSEVPELLALANRLYTKWIPKVFPWLNVPIEIEAEACEVNEPWSMKKGIEIPN